VCTEDRIDLQVAFSFSFSFSFSPLKIEIKHHRQLNENRLQLNATIEHYLLASRGTEEQKSQFQLGILNY
jgi:hypothetical protein